MKTRFTCIAAILWLILSLMAFGQTPAPEFPDNLAALGVSWNQYTSPQIGGSIMQQNTLNSSGTVNINFVDFWSTSYHPFTVAASFAPGIGQKVLKLGDVPIFAGTAIGPAASGISAGYAWTNSMWGLIRVNKSKNWYVIPYVRYIKSNVRDSSKALDDQPIKFFGGISIGFGK